MLTPPTVHVVVAADYGERLNGLPTNEAAWVADTPVNHPVIKRIWSSYPVESSRVYGTGITSFQTADDKTPEDWLLGILDSIELHHGEYSQTPPYSILHVIGATLTPRVREEIQGYGFVRFEDVSDGFIAHKGTA